jgi:hypothetical protein
MLLVPCLLRSYPTCPLHGKLEVVTTESTHRVLIPVSTMSIKTMEIAGDSVGGTLGKYPSHGKWKIGRTLDSYQKAQLLS